MTEPPTIALLDADAIGPGLTPSRPTFAHIWREYPRTQPDQVVGRLRQATYAITNKVKFTKEIIAQLPQLKLIAVTAAGCDNIDLETCKLHRVAVANVPGYATRSVAEHVIALMLALRRSVLPYHARVSDGSWSRSGLFTMFDYPIADLAGSKLGIIGAGNTGQQVGKLAQGLGMQVRFAQRRSRKLAIHPPPLQSREVERVPWLDVITQSDIISLHVPLNPDTRGMIGQSEFDAMKQQPIIVNAARGGLVDEQALAEALREGVISGIGLDVLDGEPLTEHSPLWELRQDPRVIITPHVAWSSRPSRQALWNQVIANLERFHNGQPLHAVV